jgi:nicotinate dehydrogenase subunit B
MRYSALPEPLREAVVYPEFKTSRDRGEYLEYVADCAGCHTDWYHPGSAVNEKLFAGGNELNDPATGGKIFTPNLTPDPSGISYYDETFFIQVIRNGQVGARPLDGVMPWIYYRNLNDEDLRAIFAWLQAQEPVKHIVDNTEPPSYCKRCNQMHGGGENN